MKKYLYAFLFLPATLIHELSHFLMAKILFVAVARFNLFPRMVGSMFQLGSVSIAKTDLIRESLIGLAPFFTGIAISFYLIKSGINIVTAYLLIQSVNSMFLSFSDIKAFLKLIVLLALLALIYFLIYNHIMQYT